MRRLALAQPFIAVSGKPFQVGCATARAMAHHSRMRLMGSHKVHLVILQRQIRKRSWFCLKGQLLRVSQSDVLAERSMEKEDLRT